MINVIKLYQRLKKKTLLYQRLKKKKKKTLSIYEYIYKLYIYIFYCIFNFLNVALE